MRAEKGLKRECSRVKKAFQCTRIMGVSVPSLHRESTNSLIMQNKLVKYMVTLYPLQFPRKVPLLKLCKCAKIHPLAQMLSFDQWKLLLSPCVCWLPISSLLILNDFVQHLLVSVENAGLSTTSYSTLSSMWKKSQESDSV